MIRSLKDYGHYKKSFRLTIRNVNSDIETLMEKQTPGFRLTIRNVNLNQIYFLILF